MLRYVSRGCDGRTWLNMERLLAEVISELHTPGNAARHCLVAGSTRSDRCVPLDLGADGKRSLSECAQNQPTISLSNLEIYFSTYRLAMRLAELIQRRDSRNGRVGENTTIFSKNITRISSDFGRLWRQLSQWTSLRKARTTSRQRRPWSSGRYHICTLATGDARAAVSHLVPG